MIFKDLCPSQTKNRIKDHPKYDSIINNHLKLMDEISESINHPIRATYPYIPFIESLARMTNTRKQEK